MPSKKAVKRKVKQLQNTIYAVLVIIALIAAIVIGFKDRFFPKKSVKPPKHSSVTVETLQDLTVTFMDIGQGDAIFINFPDGKNMLIDFGKADKAIADKYLTKDGKKQTVDYLVATHPDEDHIGNLPYIYENYTVNYSYRPYVLSEYEKSSAFGSEFNSGVDINRNTKIYHNYLSGVYERTKNNWEFFTDESDFSCDVICGGGTYTYTVDFVMPYAESVSGFSEFKDANDFSAIMMIEYAGKKILFTGDAESHGGKGAEDKFVSYYGADGATSVDCDVLKVGHHGSDTSTSKAFLNLVKPEYAVISCGIDNKYGHPCKKTIGGLISAEAEIYRTDLQGSIVLTINSLGEIDFKVESEANDGYFGLSGEEVTEKKEEIIENKK